MYIFRRTQTESTLTYGPLVSGKLTDKALVGSAVLGCYCPTESILLC